jgi:cellulose 1,4-beta-cellobiosidase
MLSLSLSALAQNVGTLKKEVHPALSVQECTKAGGCKTLQRSVVIDSNWRWTHSISGAQDCYNGNDWSPILCPNASACTQNCAIEGANSEYKSTYGVHAEGSSLTLSFVTNGPYSKNIGCMLQGFKPWLSHSTPSESI